MRFLLAMLIWISASMAQAGAWPREEGTFFISLSADQTGSQLYAEYGMPHDWTLGVEVVMPKVRRLPDVISFVRHPVWRWSGGAILSAGLAVELREAQAAAVVPELDGIGEIAVRAGLSWGKGFSTGLGNAWASVDAQLERVVTEEILGQDSAVKLDATFGLRPLNRLMLMIQAQGWQRKGGDATLRMETSVAWKLGPAQFVASPSIGVIGASDPRLKLGVWLDF
jgi:hypothetical protein